MDTTVTSIVLLFLVAGALADLPLYSRLAQAMPQPGVYPSNQETEQMLEEIYKLKNQLARGWFPNSVPEPVWRQDSMPNEESVIVPAEDDYPADSEDLRNEQESRIDQLLDDDYQEPEQVAEPDPEVSDAVLQYLLANYDTSRTLPNAYEDNQMIPNGYDQSEMNEEELYRDLFSKRSGSQYRRRPSEGGFDVLYQKLREETVAKQMAPTTTTPRPTTPTTTFKPVIAPTQAPRRKTNRVKTTRRPKVSPQTSWGKSDSETSNLEQELPRRISRSSSSSQMKVAPPPTDLTEQLTQLKHQHLS